MARTLMALAFAALAASPAFAQSVRYRDYGPAWYGPPPVITEGGYRGNDPDPAIRLDLRRDRQSFRGGTPH